MKKRGRKKICDSYSTEKVEVTTDTSLFGESHAESSIGSQIKKQNVTFGNLNIGVTVTKANAVVKKLDKKITSEHSLCEIIIPDRCKPNIRTASVCEDITITGEYRVENDYLLNISKYSKKKGYVHSSILEGETVFPLFERLSELTTYPLEKKTNICCWWCRHPFDVTPRVLPTKYKDGVFSYTGNFCSWACVRAYASKDKSICNRYKQNLLATFLMRLYKDGNTTGKPFSPGNGIAPPYQALNIFGGDMTITEFRESSDKFEYTKISQISGILDRNIYLYRKLK
jgi:hypothetical protein